MNPSEERKSLAKHIGYNVVAYAKAGRFGTQMEIMQSSSGDDGVYFPPSCIQITSLEGITNLRDLCDEAIAYATEREALAKNLQ